MKALDKNRDRRYDSASNFADDVVRYLNNEPVLARPASAGYLLKRAIWKHRVLFSSLAGFFLLLVVGVIVSTYFAYKANSSAKEATEAASRSEKVLSIVTAAFRSTNPEKGGNAKLLARDVLWNAKQSMDDNDLDFKGKEKILETLGDSFNAIGDYASAISIFNELIESAAQEYGAGHLETLLRKGDLSISLIQSGRHREAMELLEKNIPLVAEKMGPFAITTLGSKVNLVSAYYAQKRYDDAIELGESTLEHLKKHFGPEHRATILLMNNVAGSYEAVGRYQDALELGKETLDRMRKFLGKDFPDTLNGEVNYALYSRKAGLDPKEARSQIENTIEKMLAKVGEFHPYTLQAMRTIALMSAQDGYSEPALRWSKRAYEICLGRFGPNDPRTIKARKFARTIASEFGIE